MLIDPAQQSSLLYLALRDFAVNVLIFATVSAVFLDLFFSSSSTVHISVQAETMAIQDDLIAAQLA